MINKEEAEAVKLAAFNDELIKLGGLWSGIFKMLGKGGEALKGLGTAGKLARFGEEGEEALKAGKSVGEILKPFGTPNIVKTEGGLFNSVQHSVENGGRVQNYLSDAHSYVDNIMHNNMEGKTGVGKFTQGLKNAWQEENQQSLNAGFKQKMFADNPGKFNLDENGNPISYKGWLTNRKVQGLVTDPDGNAIGANIKKTLPMQLMAKSMTPRGMTITGLGMAGMSKQSPAEGLKDGLKDAWQWTPLTRPIGEISMLASLPSFAKNIL